MILRSADENDLLSIVICRMFSIKILEMRILPEIYQWNENNGQKMVLCFHIKNFNSPKVLNANKDIGKNLKIRDFFEVF